MNIVTVLLEYFVNRCGGSQVAVRHFIFSNAVSFSP